MIDYILVENATQFPHFCAFCGGQTHRPFLDGIREIAGNHLYICKQCARRIAQTYGFAESEELDRLTNTREVYDSVKREIAERTETLAKRDQRIRELENIVGATEEALSFERQRNDQLQIRLDQIRADTMATLDATELKPDYSEVT